jgi:hypothetical protein
MHTSSIQPGQLDNEVEHSQTSSDSHHYGGSSDVASDEEIRDANSGLVQEAEVLDQRVKDRLKELGACSVTTRRQEDRSFEPTKWHVDARSMTGVKICLTNVAGETRHNQVKFAKLDGDQSITVSKQDGIWRLVE